MFVRRYTDIFFVFLFLTCWTLVLKQSLFACCKDQPQSHKCWLGMCWWNISQPCVPHCLHSWKYTSTSPNFLFCWKPKFLNSCWSEGKLKPIGWGESISANRQPGKNNVPIDAGVIQFVSVGTSCHNVTDSQCDYEALGVYFVYIVCIIVELLYSITFRFLFLQFRFVCPGRWFPTSFRWPMRVFHGSKGRSKLCCQWRRGTSHVLFRSFHLHSVPFCMSFYVFIYIVYIFPSLF